MKKILFLLAMLPMFVLTSCSKDDDEKNDENPIINTIWEMSDHGTLISLQFYSNNTAKIIKSGKETDITVWTYTYKYPNVTLEPTESWAVSLKATINKDVITVRNPTVTSGSDIIYVLYKK